MTCAQCTVEHNVVTVMHVQTSVLCCVTSCSLVQNCRWAATATCMVQLGTSVRESSRYGCTCPRHDSRGMPPLVPTFSSRWTKTINFTPGKELPCTHRAPQLVWTFRKITTHPFRMIQPVALSPIFSASRENEKQGLKRQGY
jgi:hypothetical protein